MTSKDLKRNEPGKNKENKFKGGANIEINEKNLDESVHKNYLQLNLAIQIIC